MNLAQNHMSQAFSRNDVKIESGILHTDEIKRMKLVAGQLNLVCHTAFYRRRLRGSSTVIYSHRNLIICHIQSGYLATHITNNQVFLGVHDPTLGHACHNPHNPATVTGNYVLIIYSE